jgi:Tol biopolymer transport system component
MVGLNYPGDVQFSPDGTWVLFTIKRVVDNAYLTHVYKTKANGSDLSRVEAFDGTSRADAPLSPFVASSREELAKTTSRSPDGKFFSVIHGKNIWVQSLESGKPWQVTFSETGVV